MLVGFTSTYAIGAYHHWCCEFEIRSWSGVQHYVIKFVGDLRQVGVFLRVVWFPPPKNRPPRYNWNIVGSGIKHHKAKPSQTWNYPNVNNSPYRVYNIQENKSMLDIRLT
jgi:hypothetical protein